MLAPRFSLIIPTRDRARTLQYCLRTVTDQTYSNLEIIVSDNDSRDDTREVVESYQDSRIVYINTGKRLGMSSNWEFGLAAARGQWISFLGDDDGLLPGCFEALDKLVAKTDAQAIRTRAASYVWADVAVGHGQVALNVPMKKGWHWRDSQVWRQKVLAGFQNYSELPMLYNGGFVRKDLIDEIKKSLGGNFFHSRIPDVFSGLLLSYYVNKFVYSYEPVAINGTSSHSTGYAQFRPAISRVTKSMKAKNALEIDPAIAFANEANLPFHPSIPLKRDGGVPLSILALIYESHAQISQLLTVTESLSPSYKIDCILAAQRNFSEEFNVWIKDYDTANQTNTLTNTMRGRFRRLKYRFSFYAYRIGLIWDSYSCNADDMNYPTNIYDASIAADKIKKLQTRSISNVLRFILASYLRAKTSSKG
jgi:glycosyltransferase involved in cell wall biosynthesis